MLVQLFIHCYMSTTRAALLHYVLTRTRDFFLIKRVSLMSVDPCFIIIIGNFYQHNTWFEMGFLKHIELHLHVYFNSQEWILHVCIADCSKNDFNESCLNSKYAYQYYKWLPIIILCLAFLYPQQTKLGGGVILELRCLSNHLSV